MERISVFKILKEKNDSRNSESQVCRFGLNHSEKMFLLDWTQSPSETVEIRVDACVTVNVLEVTSTLPRNLRIILEEGSKVEWKTVLLTTCKSSQISVTLNQHASINFSVADFSEGTETMAVTIDLDGDFSQAHWHMAALSYAQDQKNISVSIHHIGARTQALVSNYGVVQGNGSLKFSGTSHILNGSHQSKTHQNAKIMVFDPNSVGRADPVLKIDENDVEASHSAAVGKVNDEHLFYLCSRGLTPNEAKRLITLGYLNPIIQNFNEESIKNQIEKSIMGRI